MITFNDHLRRFANAARLLVEDDWVDADAGRFSTTVYMSVRGSDSLEERAAVEVAVRQGLSLVVMQFGTGSAAKGPRCCTVVGRAEDGSAVIAKDCAFYLGHEYDELVAVTRGPDAASHFVSVQGRLEHRSGRPASLTAGIIRAGRSMVDAARDVATDTDEGIYVVGSS